MQCKESDFSKAPQNVEASEDCIGYCGDGMWPGSETREERVWPGNELERPARGQLRKDSVCTQVM